MCKLEAADAAPSVLKAYDRVTGRWPFPPGARFWKAVEHAHQLGRRGSGHKVAIVDSACDMSIPRVRDRVDRMIRCVPRPLPENTEHGTAVLLLIAAVAPECRFDVYAVRRDDGTIADSDVAYAVGEAAKSDADIVNLSLGAWQTAPDIYERIARAGQEAISACDFGPSPKRARSVLLDQILPDAGCTLCQAASAAAENGKLVFAAAGNSAREIYCPARAEPVLASGFQTGEKRTVVPGPDGGRLERNAAAVEGQSLFVDLPLEELPGVLGTSFASPLYAGLAALGVSAKEFNAYVSALPMTGMASAAREQISVEVGKVGGYTPEMQVQLQQAMGTFLAALERLPHVHSQLELNVRKGRQDAVLTDPAACAACGFLAYPLYVNFGLLLLERQYFQDAKQLLEAARAIAPWSDAAAADLGRALEALGDLEGALKNYEFACAVAPGTAPYEESRRRIADKLAAARVPQPDSFGDGRR